MNLKCKIGWHDWETETEQKEIITVYKTRCKRCDKVEVFNIAVNIIANPYVITGEFEEFKQEMIQRLEKLEK